MLFALFWNDKIQKLEIDLVNALAANPNMVERTIIWMLLAFPSTNIKKKRENKNRLKIHYAYGFLS